MLAEEMKFTEGRNLKTVHIDAMTSFEIVQLMNEEDKMVPLAVESQLENIAQLADMAVSSLKTGGRLIYIGAGTSGRLGVLDAAECVPTFGVSPDLVVGLIAGGEKAMLVAIEGAEDSKELGEMDLINKNLTKNDLVIGLAASGRTPYVIGGLAYARKIGAKTGAISCNKHASISDYADVAIEVIVGPEVLTGSTRLKSGTAQKLVLNMISTSAMIRIGKVYQNLMVDVQPTNQKLVDRAQRIIMEATGVDAKTAKSMYEKSDKHPKTAIVMILGEVDKVQALEALNKVDGVIRLALKEL